ncbi:YopX family protein [Staphylococcus hominis]|uniref:YopX family protein n=1 Tax=Staphylococcus hominis TaxID=1290 RepID=UPI0030BEE985
MKNFKFRAWDKDHKYMEYTDKNLIVSFGDNGNVDATDLSNIYSTCNGMQNFELMQSTGLKDDFGNELFEGDIFESRFSGIKYVVYWDDKLASFWIKGETKTHPLYTLTPFHPRILGNIYENPELLEG